MTQALESTYLVESESESGLHVLYDPEALRDPARHTPSRTDAWVDEESAAGRMLAYDAGGDGDLHAELVVDVEPARAPWEAPARVVDAALLRVPGGRLWLTDGVHALHAAREPDSAGPGAPPPDGTAVSVPPGAYRVDVELLAGTRASRDARERRIAEEIERRTDPTERWLGRWGGTVAVVSLLVSLPVALVALFLIVGGHPLLGFLIFGAATAIGLAGLLLARLAPNRRLDRVRRQVHRDFPSHRIRLTPLPDGTDLDAYDGATWSIDDDLEAEQSPNGGHPSGR